jgi:hypothetical protein
MRIVFAILLSAMQFALAADTQLMQLSKDASFTNKDVPQTWGVVSNRLCCAIRLPQKSAKADGGIPLELYFKNVGDKSVLLTNPYDLRGEPWIWTLSIVGPRGRVPYTGDTVVYALTLKELKPGEIVRYIGTVRAPVWDISERGRYTLKVKYEASGAKPGDTRPIWGGTIHSNEAEGFVK